jgi:outer membrane PBP1 activator LpoA protein
MIDTEFTSVPKITAKNVALIAALAWLASCTTQPRPSTPVGGIQTLETRAATEARNGNWSAAATLYAELATAVTGSLRSGYLIESARSSVEMGDTATARRRLTEARAAADRDQQQAIVVLLARLELEQQRPQAALDMLAALQAPLSSAVLRDAAAVRAGAFFRLGAHADAVRALVEREIWLEDAAAILANQRMIWEGFRRFPPAGPPEPTGDAIIDGWLALAPLAVSPGGADLRRALLGWRSTYTDHPAAGGLLAELLAAERAAGFPTQIALLLPLGSPQRVAALAIRDGFMAAHLRNPNADATAVRVYDTALLGSREAYLRAQLEGADFIVGPLLRPEVDEVITQAGFVPTLALNFAQTETPFLRSFYQFALAPEDEARVIAQAAAAAGATTAIAFVASDDRGYRLLNAFRGEFEALGGQLLDFSGYDPGLQDFSQPIAALLNITRSNQRYRRLAANLGVPVQFEPRRRQDVDMIFLAADARAGRLLAPQLRFHFAGDIPTYATSDIFDIGGNVRNNDLNGVIFTDAPSVVAPDQTAADVQRDLQSYWPQRASQARLYAMGFDAYRLAASLYTDGSQWPVRGLSGDLQLDGQGRVHRSLPLAQFQNGRPVAIETPGASAENGRELVGFR